MIGCEKKISILKPRFDEKDVEQIIKKEHTWLSGLIPPRSFKIEEYQDFLVPYLITGVCYYKKIGQRRRCFVFNNLELGIKSGVAEIDNLEFLEIDAPSDLRPIKVDEETHHAEIAHYCNFDLLVKNYRKYIDWTIEILEIKPIYRLKRVVRYTVNGKVKTKTIFLDSMILK